MTEVLQEYVDSRGVALRVDRAAGVLRGVKLIGLDSLNGRRYRPQALAAAIGLYEGAKVNVNHPQGGPLAPRDYRDRLGVIRQVEFRPEEGLFGNLHFNPKHAVAEQLAWDADHNPRNVGFSHNVLARLTRDGAETLVEAITHVQSVDLVADPAATQGLFEQEERGGEGSHSGVAEELTTRLTRMEAELAESRAREGTLQRRLAISEAVERHRPIAAGSEPLAERLGKAFYDALLAAGDEGQVESLIAERAESLRQAAALQESRGHRQTTPRSSEPWALAQRGVRVESTQDFVRSIRGNGINNNCLRSSNGNP